QLLTNGQHKILHGAFRAVDRRGQATGAVGPVHAIQALIASASDPALHRPQSHAKSAGNLAEGHTTTDSFHHLATPFAESVFCSWQSPQGRFLAMLRGPGDFRVLALG